MEGNVSVEEEILKADDLMYAEKQQYYHAILQGDRRARTGIATELLEDIADHRFEVYYQPQICLKTGRIIGAEALVRKKNKRGSLILPDHFIPHYERERVICHLDLFVFQTVCADWQKWKRQGDGNPYLFQFFPCYADGSGYCDADQGDLPGI